VVQLSCTRVGRSFLWRDPCSDLQAAARRRDTELLKACIAKSADLLARDGNRKMPIDVAKDEKIKAILRQGQTFYRLSRAIR
jgi:hypothetical protein